MPTTWSECTFLKAEKISPNTQLFFFKVDTNFSFIAGQFITFDLPVSEKRSQRWKSFSIANSSFDTNVIELCISHVDGGLATNFLFQEMKVGTKLKFKGPDGQFVFHEKNKDKNHILNSAVQIHFNYLTCKLQVRKHSTPFDFRNSICKRNFI